MSLKMFITFAILALCQMAIAAPLEGQSYTPVSISGYAPMPLVHNFTAEYLSTLPLEEVPPSLPAQHLQPRKLPKNLKPADIRKGGVDDRVVLDKEEYPFNAFGRLVIKSEIPDKTITCSGSLVGPRHVMVARHCMKSDSLQLVRKVTFQPNYFNGSRHGESFVTDAIIPDWIQGGLNCYESNDWAILILADRVGDKYGYLGVKAVDCETQSKKPIFSHVGYPRDYGYGIPTFQDNISMKKCNQCRKGSVRANADSTSGQSGGPLFIVEDGLPWLYGVYSTGYLFESGFTTGEDLVKAAAQARKDYP